MKREGGVTVARRVLILVAVIALVLTAFPAVAGAESIEYHSATRRVTGPDAVAEAIKMLRSVELGARATTVTLEVDGAAHDVRLDYGALEQEVTGREEPTFIPLAMLAMVVGVVSRGLRMFARIRSVAR